MLALAQHEPADERADHARAPRGRGTRPRTLRRGDRRQRERADEASDRDRGLPHAEREPALLASNQCMTARPLDEFTLAPAAPASASRHEQRAEALGERRADDERRARRQSDGQHDPLPEAVRGETPRQQGQRRAHPLRREQDADLAERQRVFVAQRRHENRQPDDERRDARGRERPGGEHRPPVRGRSTARRG